MNVRPSARRSLPVNVRARPKKNTADSATGRTLTQRLIR
jgi:hypothetical protein